MASVASSSRCSGLLLPPSLAGVRSWSPPSSSLRLRPRPRQRAIACVAPPESAEPQTDEQDVKAESTEEVAQTSSTSQDAGLPALPNKDINRRVALVSTLGALALFASQRLDLGQASLKDLAANAVAYEEVNTQHYLALVLYLDRVNFVMLNVDNTKWEQELDEFGVEGIPHFAFLDKEGNEEGNVVGRLPKQYFLENVVALASGDPNIPHARVVGQFSSAENRRVHQVADPRSHG
ncbi:hypothetical protein PR202_gb10821 [Eleusine coracana subsp. coracana]|uniref:Thioredoxin domain-containing protein n=1 Tax=Eleusine coracana subsp. coracana TaxID=191504 RepID=A0AAV5EKZ4_ELECO|nr:hypothetical protein PR202_gb10821 [Eleusine coracana subsp. coracana]